MAAIVANIGSNNWNTNGAWVGAVQPTAADDVTIPASANVSITGAITVNCRSCTVSASGTLTFGNAATNILQIGDATAGAGNVALSVSSSATISLAATPGTIQFISTSATQQTIATGGLTMPNVTFVGAGGSWLNSDAMTVNATITFAAGTWATGNFAITATTINFGNATARTFTPGSSAISCTTWTMTTNNSLTISANTATATVSGNITLNSSSGFTWNGLSFIQNGAGAATCGAVGTVTVGSYTRTGTAVKTDSLSLTAGINLTCTTFTTNANSATNRLLILSATLGTAVTITAGTFVATNVVDFMDITGAGAATWTVGASGATALGDAQGNSGITFTTPATQTNDGAAGNWGDVARWSSRVPLPQDPVAFSGGSGAITIDMPRLGKDIDFTGYSGTVTDNAVVASWYGSFTISTGMTLSSNQEWDYRGRTSSNFITNGKLTNWNVNLLAPGGTLTHQDAMTMGSTTSAVFVTNGTWATNGFTMTMGSFSTVGTAVKGIILGTSIINLVRPASVSLWAVVTTNLTLSAASSTIVFAGAHTGTRTFDGGGATFGTLQYTVAESYGALQVTGADTFSAINTSPEHSIILPASTVTTITNFTAAGVSNGYNYMGVGLSTPYALVPDSVPLSFTSGIDLRIRIAPDSWTAAQALIGKWTTGGTTKSWGLRTEATGALTFFISSTGGNNTSAVSTAGTGFSAGTTNWVRVTWNSTTKDCNFYTAVDQSAEPSSWTQVGTTVALNTTMFDSDASVQIGTSPVGSTLPVKFYRAIVYDAVGGTKQLDADFTTKTVGANTFTETSANAATVTIGADAQLGDGRISLSSSSAGTAATLSRSAGTVATSYLNVKDITATGGNGITGTLQQERWSAGPGGVDLGNNKGWGFNRTVPTIVSRPHAFSPGLAR